MKSLLIAAMMAAVLIRLPAFAEEKAEGRSDLTQNEVSGKKNKPAGDDVDEIITNIKMRAETGSKSRWSIATAMGYSAGSVQKPMDAWRPNLSGVTGSTDATNFSGTVSVKYALNTKSSLFSGIGMRWITPFEGSDVPRGYNGEKFDIENPYLTYQYLYRWLGVQSAFNINQRVYTNTNLKKDGYVTSTSFSQNNMYDIGTTGLSAGLSAYLDLNFFDNDSARARRNQSDHAFGLSPALEYRISDKMNVRTDLNLVAFRHDRSQPERWTYVQNKLVQGLSFGYAITRDIYISPGMQWNPENIRADRTTTWLAANINIF